MNASDLESAVSGVVSKIFESIDFEAEWTKFLRSRTSESAVAERLQIEKDLSACKRKISNLVDALAEGLTDKAIKEKLASLRIEEGQMEAALQDRLDAIMSSNLSREKFYESLTKAKKDLASKRPEELQVAYAKTMRIDFDLETRGGTCTFYMPLPVTEFSVDSPRMKKDRSAPTLYYPRVAMLMRVPFNLEKKAA